MVCKLCFDGRPVSPLQLRMSPLEARHTVNNIAECQIVDILPSAYLGGELFPQADPLRLGRSESGQLQFVQDAPELRPWNAAGVNLVVILKERKQLRSCDLDLQLPDQWPWTIPTY